MVLYYFNNGAIGLNLILHKVHYHNNEELTVICPYAKEETIFKNSDSKVIKINNSVGRDKTLKERVQIEKEVVRYFDSLFDSEGIDFGCYSEIYFIYDWVTPLTAYFEIKNIGYNFIEAGTNYQYKFNHETHWEYKNFSKSFLEFTYEWGGGGALGKKLQKSYILHSTEKDKVLSSNYEFYNPNEIILNLSDNQKKEILSLFETERLGHCYNNIFFPNQLGTIGSLIFEYNGDFNRNYRLLNSLFFLDFYLDNEKEYFIKLHPHDYANGAYKQYAVFCGDERIFPLIPSQFLKWIPSFHLTNMFVITSSASRSDISENVIQFGHNYYRFFFSLPSVYFLLFLADAHKLYDVTSQKVDYDQIREYAKLAFPTFSKEFSKTPGKGENSFQIIDMREIMNAPGIKEQMPIFNSIASLQYKRAALALINFDYKRLFEDSLFNCGFINKFCLLVKIGKTQVKPQILMDLNDEYILLWVKDPSLRAEILKTNATKALPNTGVKLFYKVFELSQFMTPVLEFKTGGGIND
jgi:hypothetical protein